jgi:hypothetical protein
LSDPGSNAAGVIAGGEQGLGREGREMTHVRTLALVFGLLAPSGLLAQHASRLPPLDSGVTVRLYLRSGRRVAGKLLVQFAPDSTRFRFCRYPAPPCVIGGHRYVEQPAGQVWRLEIRRGSHAVPGVIVGSALGLGVGALGIGFAEGVSDWPISTGQKVTTLSCSVLCCAALGLLVGAGLDSWRPLY